MAILLTHTSALEYWRSCSSVTDKRLQNALLGNTSKRRNATNSATKHLRKPESQKQTISYLQKNPNAHTLLLGKQSHPSKSYRRPHTSVSLPPYSCSTANLHFQNEKMYVSTPECCFLQMAELLSLPSLILLGFELCGTYSLNDGNTIFNTFQLTSTEKLSSFLTKAKGFNGTKKCRRAIRYVIDNSASPMESTLAIILTLPYMLGGFGIKQPLMNHRVDLPTSMRKSSGNQYYVCDLFWPDSDLAIEYDSDLAHSGIYKTAKDALRRSYLTSLGLSVLSVTRPQIMNTQAMYQLAHLVSKQTGKQLRYSGLKFKYKHQALRSVLFSLPERKNHNDLHYY